jgi:hypothetical protein
VVTGEATGHDGGGESGASCSWGGGEVRELSQLDLRLLERGRELTGVEDDGGVPAQLSSGEGEERGRGRCEKMRGSGRPFYRRTEEGRSGDWRAPARRTAPTIMAAQWWQWDGSVGTVVCGYTVTARGDERCQTLLVSE